MSTAQEFHGLYRNVSQSILSAMEDMEKLEVENSEGKEHLSNMMHRLAGIQGRFEKELELLEEHAEWETFTMAFFGETNAGKSTIIESLRILFEEESRTKLLKENQGDLDKLALVVQQHAETVRVQLYETCGHYMMELSAFQETASELSEILRDEASARVEIQDKLVSTRVKLGLAFAALVGGGVGAGLSMMASGLLGV